MKYSENTFCVNIKKRLHKKSCQTQLTSVTCEATHKKHRLYQDTTLVTVAMRTDRRYYVDIREDLLVQISAAVPTRGKIVTRFICSYL